MSFSVYSRIILGVFSASLQDFSAIFLTHSEFRPNLPPLSSPSLRKKAKERSNSQATLQDDSQKINLPFLETEETIMHFSSCSNQPAPNALLLPYSLPPSPILALIYLFVSLSSLTEFCKALRQQMATCNQNKKRIRKLKHSSRVTNTLSYSLKKQP